MKWNSVTKTVKRLWPRVALYLVPLLVVAAAVFAASKMLGG